MRTPSTHRAHVETRQGRKNQEILFLFARELFLQEWGWGKESQAEESQDLRAGLTLYPVSPFFFGSPPETLGTRPDWERCLLIDIVPKGPQ